MYLTGFADEGAAGIDGQIRAIKELGWGCLECRNVDGENLTNISDQAFDSVCAKLESTGIRINCFGSAIANWAKKITDPADSSYEEMKRAIPRMHRLGTKMIRVMSFSVSAEQVVDPAVGAEAIKRMKVLTKMAEDGGAVLVHENCDGWASASYEHTLRLLDAIPSPALRLVFDTGNPVNHNDVRGEPPYGKQNALEFYNRVKDHVIYVHIKDGRMVDDTMVFTFPGDGDGCVRPILADLKARGYDGGISIEPHMAAVAHDPSITSPEDIKYANFVEYGRRMERLLDEIGWKPGGMD